MDNPGDWLYIVLMAVAVISSIISAVKKKKQEAETHEQPETELETVDEASEEKGFWEVLQDMQHQEESRRQEARRQQQARETVATPRPARSPFLAGEKTTKHIHRQAALVPEPDPIPLITAETFNDPEELRKAVILTEILNRKY